MRTCEQCPVLPFVLTLTLLWCAAALAAEPLPSDPRIQAGRLDNGVTWHYRQHDNPPGRMALMIRVDAGSLHETDQQRGLAHFMEHMVFNGTENFPPGTLVPYFESIGMQFGADLNAFTSFDQTVYMLYIPDTSLEQVDKALLVLSDYAFRATLIEEEIEKERGVILAEARTGKSAEQRIRDELWPTLFKGSRFADRLPIGKEEIISTAPRSEFVDFYRTWYRPENLSVLLVGDAPPDDIIPLIEKWFGETPTLPPPRPAPGAQFRPFSQPRAMVMTDVELTRGSVQLMNLREGRPPTTTVAQRRTELVEGIGAWIINRRLRERIDAGQAGFRSARAGVSDFYREAMLTSANATGEPADWARMLDELITEVNRARIHGFSERELELARTELLSGAERAVRTEATRDGRAVIREILSAVNAGTPVLSAQQQLELYQRLLPTIGREEVEEAFRAHFAPGAYAYVVELPEREGVAVPTADEVLEAARAAWEREVAPPQKSTAPTDILEELPPPGEVVERATDEDLGVTSLWFANGVRVHHRYVDYREDNVMISISLAGGAIEETAENLGVTTAAALVLRDPATSRLSTTNIRDILTGKNIRVGGSAAGRGGRRGGGGGARQSGDALTISVSGSPLDLETGLQLANALLTDGRIEETAFNNWKLQSLQQLERMQTAPAFQAMEALAEMLSGADPRRRTPTAAELQQLTLTAAQDWYDRLRREAPIEVAVVGTVRLDDLLPLIQRYLGSLPPRERSAGRLAELRRLARPDGPFVRNVEVQTITPQAMALAGFVAADGRDPFERRAFTLAAQILTSRLVKEIREDRSLVYSIRAGYQPSWVYDDAASFSAGAPCDPADAQRVAAEVHAVFTDFAAHGPTEEELSNAIKQVTTGLDAQMKEPGYWLRALQHLDLRGRDLAEHKTEMEAYEHYTAEQVREVFEKYYKPQRRFTVTSVPTDAGGGDE